MKGSLILLITILLLSCSKKAPLFCENEISILKNEETETVVLNLNLDSEALINNLQSQTSTNLCKSPNLNGSILINEEKIKFKLKIAKSCSWSHKPTNMIRININKNNQILLTNRYDSFLIEDLALKLNEATNKIIKVNKSPSVIYELEWNNGINTDSLKNRFYEIFSVISKVSDSISRTKFNKTLCELKKQELNQIDSIFSGKITIGTNLILDLLLPPKEVEKYFKK